MKKLEISASAKINMGLSVLDKRVDGYHYIKTYMHAISLHDKLTFEKSDATVLFCEDKNIPCNEQNIVVKCIRAMEDLLERSLNMRVYIEKNIPSSAGLGGGSADGAATMTAANILYNLNLDRETLCALAKSVGADIPFFFYNNCCFCEGIGEIITPKDYACHDYIVVLKPAFGISTRDAYEMIDCSVGKSAAADYSVMEETLRNKSVQLSKKCFINDFERYAFQTYKELLAIKRDFITFGAYAAQMSGSGPAMYGLFEHRQDALQSFEYFKKYYKNVYLTNLISKPLEIIC